MDLGARAVLKRIGLATALLMASVCGGGASPSSETGGPDANDTVRAAERWFAEGSYQRARDEYAKAAAQSDSRWNRFRILDSTWRAQAQTGATDDTALQTARAGLEKWVEDERTVESHDRVWAEVEESLGDFYWLRTNSRNWYGGWSHYQAALDFWAGSPDLELARKKYLAMVWRITDPPNADTNYRFGYYGTIPMEIVVNVHRLARTPREIADASYLWASSLRRQGDYRQRAKVPQLYEAALGVGKQSPWYDDALFEYAQWNAGERMTRTAKGGWESSPDYERALALYRRLLQEFRKGESRYYDAAKQAIDDILRVEVSVGVPYVFAPGSTVRYSLSWKNTAEVALALYPVDLPRDVAFKKASSESAGSWVQTLPTKNPLKSWTYPTKDDGHHRPGEANLKIEPALKPGAYLLEARAGNQRAREVILITDLTVVLKTSPSQAVAFVCNALDGSPVGQAEVTLWTRSYIKNDYVWARQALQTGADGLAQFQLPAPNNSTEVWVGAKAGSNQTLAMTSTSSAPSEGETWKIFAFTDRPTYRPEDTVEWKVVARQHQPQGYFTPAGKSLRYQIFDPQGAKISEGTAKLNAFGSAWGSTQLGTQLPLGEYRLRLEDGDTGSTIGNATLFRLEEYKLPEFKVSVRPIEEQGKPRVYRLGDTVEAELTAEYYFGGPVAGAEVEVVVYQRPSPKAWHPYRRYPWFYGDMDFAPNYGAGQAINRETYRTDARGIARVKFETQAEAGMDMEYRIEARVRDASRREVVGQSSIRVGQQAYSALLHVPHEIYAPGDPIAVTLETKDANDKPVSASGEMKVIRERWVEVWQDSRGKKVEHSLGAPMPPLSGKDQQPWVLLSAGYEHEDVLTRSVKTGPNGEAEMRFNAQKDGYYRIAFTARDGDDDIVGETSVFVAAPGTRELGYHSGGLDILLDADTVKVGQKTPVLILSPTSEKWVLFSVEADDLLQVQVVHVTGNVKRVDLAIEDKDVPNIFLSAAMVSDRQMLQASKQVVVPPAGHFLDVQVTPDREQVRPGEKGTWKVLVKNADGKPVAAEVSLAVSDESVYAIQEDYAGDPRSFFFGTKRGDRTGLQAMSGWRGFVPPEEANDLSAKNLRGVPAGGAGGMLGGERHRAMRRKDMLALTKSAAASELEDKLSREEPDDDEKQKEIGTRAHAAMDAPSAPPESPAAATAPVTAPVTVRHDFRATAAWVPDVISNAQGQATVSVKYPDTLTRWRATARVASSGSQFGSGSGSTRAELPFQVRLEAPRFFVVGDSVVISALVNNHSNDKLSAEVMLEASGVDLEGMGSGRSVKVTPMGEGRVEWKVQVKKAGPVKLKLVARAAGFHDAVEQSFVAHDHGIDKLVVRSGQVPEGGARAQLELPEARRSTRMTIQVTPSIAATALDALPYLIDYPYGCTEQTLSRFLPAVVVAKTLNEQGLKPGQIAGHLFGGVDPETRALRPGSQAPKDLTRLDAMVQSGLARLYDFQHGDGGWAWWKDGNSDRFMTSYVIWGLSLARDAGIAVRPDVLARGSSWLEKELVQEEQNPDAQAWMLHALVSYQPALGAPQRFGGKAFENLWKRREGMNAYSRALLTLVAHALKAKDRAEILARNLENGAVLDARPDVSPLGDPKTPENNAVMGTAHWGKDGVFYRWSDGGVEATAFVLRALLAENPENPLVPSVMNWLVKNRRGAQWSNTRDTAIVVLAMNDYLKTHHELAADYRYEVRINGRSVADRKVTPQDALSGPSLLSVDASLLHGGANDIEIRKTGKGAMYFAASAEFFSLEEPLTPAGNEVFVRRQYFRQVPHQTLLKGTVYSWEPLPDEGKLVSGERVEVVVTVEAKNNYSYLLFEDLKPAGLEAVELKSGEPMSAQQLRAGQEAVPARPDTLDNGKRYTQHTVGVHQELRDRKVALFFADLPQGFWEVHYALRAEVPGHFHGLPVMGHAMYVPEVRANSAEARLTVSDAQ